MHKNYSERVFIWATEIKDYTINTDFSFKNHISKKKQEEYKHKEVQIGIQNIMLKVQGEV